ncbi:MAG: maleylpyruvate isomerase family mycothiol-dependent enzyme [Bowdeniella nasicola]|nr:maleylpyruvate isomerase family mycothiol-dependent enzyme [Bowdeniella nasicola]
MSLRRAAHAKPAAPPTTGAHSLAQRARHELAGYAEAVGPTAPTLCDGWQVADLIAHLYVREHRPTALVGITGGMFAHVAEDEMRRVLTDRGFDALLNSVATGPPKLLARFDSKINTLEYLVHGEDIRRANPNTPLAPMDVTYADREEIAGYFGAACAFLSAPNDQLTYLQATDIHRRERTLRQRPTWVLGSEREHRQQGYQHDTVRRVRGPVRELVLYAFGRRAVADVVITRANRAGQ